MSKEGLDLPPPNPNIHDDPVPPYEQTSNAEKPTSSRGDSLASTLAQVRRQRILHLIQSTIEPLLVGHAQSGITKRIFALIPADSSEIYHKVTSFETQPDARHSDEIDSRFVDVVVGFSDDEDVTIVRLHGQDNSVRFWKQPSVIQDLDTELRIRMGIPRPLDEQPLLVREPPPARPKKGFFTRKNSLGLESMNKSASVRPIARCDAPPIPGDVALRVSVEEIWLRRPTDMGLYETRACQAVLIRVHIG